MALLNCSLLGVRD